MPPLGCRASGGTASRRPWDDGGPRGRIGSVVAGTCTAATSHGFDRLRLLYDVAQAVRGAAGPVDEAWLSAAAVRTGSALALETALHLAADVLPEPRCEDLLQRLNLPPASWLTRAALTRGTVLRAHAAVDGLRRQAFRELLKRK